MDTEYSCFIKVVWKQFKETRCALDFDLVCIDPAISPEQKHHTLWNSGKISMQARIEVTGG